MSMAFVATANCFFVTDMREILLHKVVISLGKKRPLIRGMNRMACKLNYQFRDSRKAKGTACLILAKLCIAVGNSLKDALYCGINLKSRLFV